MPDLGERAVRLYYDASCGPCTLLARASEGISRHRLEVTPLDAAQAATELKGLTEEARFGSAHLVRDGTVWTGAKLTTPLVALAFGPSAGRLLHRIRPAEDALRWAYVRLWTYLRTRGCAAPPAG